MVDVAQLVRAPGCGPGGRGFDPLHSPQIRTLILVVFVESKSFFFAKSLDIIKLI